MFSCQSKAGKESPERSSDSFIADLIHCLPIIRQGDTFFGKAINVTFGVGPPEIRALLGVEVFLLLLLRRLLHELSSSGVFEVVFSCVSKCAAASFIWMRSLNQCSADVAEKSSERGWQANRTSFWFYNISSNDFWVFDQKKRRLSAVITKASAYFCVHSSYCSTNSTFQHTDAPPCADCRTSPVTQMFRGQTPGVWLKSWSGSEQ